MPRSLKRLIWMSATYVLAVAINAYFFNNVIILLCLWGTYLIAIGCNTYLVAKEAKAAHFKRRWHQVVLNEEPQGFAAYLQPTLKQRIWRKLGFVYHMGAEPPDEILGQAHGWMRTSSFFHFSWGDRLRLLLTGRLRVTTSIHTKTSSEHLAERVDWQILPWGKNNE